MLDQIARLKAELYLVTFYSVACSYMGLPGGHVIKTIKLTTVTMFSPVATEDVLLEDQRDFQRLP